MSISKRDNYPTPPPSSELTHLFKYVTAEDVKTAYAKHAGKNHEKKFNELFTKNAEVPVDAKTLAKMLNAKEEIRFVTLDAYKKGFINSDALKSLFLFAGAMEDRNANHISFYQVVSRSEKPSHKNELTPFALQTLIPYLVKSTPQARTKPNTKITFYNLLKTKLSTIAATDNLVGYYRIPLLEIYKMSFALLYLYKDGERNSEFLKYSSAFFKKVAKTLNIDITDLNDKSSYLRFLVELISKIKSKVPASDYDGLTLDEYHTKIFNDKKSYFYYILLEQLPSIELFPIQDTDGFALIVISSTVKDAWQRATVEMITMKQINEDNVSKSIPVFGILTPEQVTEFTIQGHRPIGLYLPGLPWEHKVHNLPAAAHATQEHDDKFHQKILFFLLQLRPTVFISTVKLCNTISRITHRKLNPIIWDALDFKYIWGTIKTSEDYKELIDIDVFYYDHGEKTSLRAEYILKNEYAFIVFCELLKNSEYLALLSLDDATLRKQILPEMWGGLFREINNIEYFVFHLKKYSHSLGAFMCLMYQHREQLFPNDPERKLKIANICQTLDNIEKHQCMTKPLFSWYIKEGVKLTLGNKVFRFCRDEKSGDSRLDKYKIDAKTPSISKNNKTIYFSSSPQWFVELTSALCQELDNMIVRETQLKTAPKETRTAVLASSATPTLFKATPVEKEESQVKNSTAFALLKPN